MCSAEYIGGGSELFQLAQTTNNLVVAKARDDRLRSALACLH